MSSLPQALAPPPPPPRGPALCPLPRSSDVYLSPRNVALKPQLAAESGDDPGAARCVICLDSTMTQSIIMCILLGVLACSDDRR